MVKSEIIRTLQELKNEIQHKYKAEIKGVFGSYVRGEQKLSSDIDILVLFLDGATLYDLVGLSDFLESRLQLKVDIVPIDTIKEEIKEDILQEAVYI